MIGPLLLSFLGGIISVLVLEILELEALLAPLRSFIAALIPGG